MPLVIPPGFGLAAYTFSGSEGTPDYITTMGLDLSAAGGDFVGAANSAMEAFIQAFGDQLSDRVTLDGVQLAVGQDGPGGSVDSTNDSFTFTATGTPEPVAMAVIARKITNTLGRRGRGRMFLPGSCFDADVESGGQVDDAKRIELNQRLAQYVDLLNNPAGTQTVATPPVLLHSSPPTDPTPVIGMSVAPLVGWIRGRIR